MKDLHFTEPVTIQYGDFDTPFIASLPHSGTFIPPELIGLYTADHLSRLRNTDWHLPEIYAFLPSIGVTTVAANFSRYVIDVNRGLEQRQAGRSYRSSLIYRKDTWGDPILKNPQADLKEEFRIANFYNPYHVCLKRMIQQKLAKFGKVFLLDLHSFAVNVYPRRNPNLYPPDASSEVYLGAGDFSEFGPNLKTTLFTNFNRNGLVAGETVNLPGGHIVRYHGLHPNVEACMIELKYTTYMPDSATKGDHMPAIDWNRARPTQEKLKKALTNLVSAYSKDYQKRCAYLPL